MSRVVTYLDGSTGEVRQIQLDNSVANAVVGLDRSWAYKKDNDPRLAGIRHLPKAQQYLHTDGQAVSPGHVTDVNGLSSCNVGPYTQACPQRYRTMSSL
jgi:hypothetical protein